MDLDLSLLTASALLPLATLIVAVYYRRIKKVGIEYTRARSVIEDIIISFNKQFHRQEESLAKTSFKLEGLLKKNDDTAISTKALETKLVETNSRIKQVTDEETSLRQDVEKIRQTICDITRVQTEIKSQISDVPEPKIETVIPIKREHALAPLTDTELRVLEIIARGSEKTAPQIKDLIKLTREHTARLVKKLYEEGYLERSTTKTPYAYTVKEEMLKILKRTETEA